MVPITRTVLNPSAYAGRLRDDLRRHGRRALLALLVAILALLIMLLVPLDAHSAAYAGQARLLVVAGTP